VGDLAKGIIGAVEIVAGALIPGAQFLIPAGIGMVAGSVADALSKRTRLANKVKDLGDNLTDPASSLAVVYGRAKVGLDRVFFNTSTYQGDLNYHLYLVGALCHGPVLGIDEVYFDGNFAFGADGTIVSSPVVSPARNYLGSAAVWKAYGTDSQMTVEPRTYPLNVTGLTSLSPHQIRLTLSADHPYVVGDVLQLTGVTGLPTDNFQIIGVPSLSQVVIETVGNFSPGGGGGGTVDYFTPDLASIFGGQWTTAHNGRGVAWIVVRLNFDAIKFANGIPKIEVVVRGKPLHDPRAVKTLAISTVAATAGVSPYQTITSVTTTTAHGLVVGQIVHITGASATHINGYQRVGIVGSATQFSVYAVPLTTGAGGSIDVLPATNILAHPYGVNPNHNPALAVRDYLCDTRFGTSVAETEINETAFASEANYCDTLFPVPWEDRKDLVPDSFYITHTAPSTDGSNGTVIDFSEQITGRIAPGDVVRIENTDIVSLGAPGAADTITASGPGGVAYAIVTLVSFSSIEVDIFSVLAGGNSGVVTVVLPAGQQWAVSRISASQRNADQTHAVLTLEDSPAEFVAGMSGYVASCPQGNHDFLLNGPQGIISVVGTQVTVSGATGGTDGPGGFFIARTPPGEIPSTVPILSAVASGGATIVALDMAIMTYGPGSQVLIQGTADPALNGTWTVASTLTDGISVNTITVPHTLAAALGAGGTAQQQMMQPQYQVNGALDSSLEVKDNIGQILATYRASLIYQAGQYRSWTRRVVVPAGFLVDESVILGDWEFVTPSTKDLANVAKVLFTNRFKNAQRDWAIWPDPDDEAYDNTFLAQDNGVFLRKELEVPLCDSPYQAQAIAQIARRESRKGLVVGVTCRQSALALAFGDVIAVTHATPGWEAKEFWVLHIGILPDFTVRLTLGEYDPTAYTLETYAGSLLIEDTSDGVGGTPPVIETESVFITPGTASVAVGGTVTFTGSAENDLGVTVPDTFTYESSDDTIATVDPSTGAASGVADGVATITATDSGGRSASATLTVTGAVVTRVITTIVVTPSSASVVIGGNQTYAAQAFDQLGAPIAATFVWSSSVTADGTINSSTGVALGVAVGTTTITAAAGGKTGTATLTVTAPPGAMVVLAPGTFLTATVAALAGGGSGFSVLAFRMRFLVDSLLGTPTAGNLFSIFSTGSGESLEVECGLVGSAIRFSFTANNGVANWPLPGTVAQSALPAAGTGIILYAAYIASGPAFGFALVTDAGVVLFSSSVSGSAIGPGNTPSGNTTVNIGASHTGVGFGTGGMTIDGFEITSALISAPQDIPSLADPDQIELITFDASDLTSLVGSTFTPVGGTPTFIPGGLWGTAASGTPVITTLVISPTSTTVGIGGNVTIAASAEDQFSNPIADTITYTSSNTAIATVNSSTGVVTGVAVGTVTITASDGIVTPVTATVVVTTATPVLTSLVMSPTGFTGLVGAMVTAVATGRDQFSAPFTDPNPITYTSSFPSIASVNSSTGRVTLVAVGSATITANDGHVAPVTMAVTVSAGTGGGGGGGGGGGVGGNMPAGMNVLCNTGPIGPSSVGLSNMTGTAGTAGTISLGGPVNPAWTRNGGNGSIGGAWLSTNPDSSTNTDVQATGMRVMFPAGQVNDAAWDMFFDHAGGSGAYYIGWKQRWKPVGSYAALLAAMNSGDSKAWAPKGPAGGDLTIMSWLDASIGPIIGLDFQGVDPHAIPDINDTGASGTIPVTSAQLLPGVHAGAGGVDIKEILILSDGTVSTSSVEFFVNGVSVGKATGVTNATEWIATEMYLSRSVYSGVQASTVYTDMDEILIAN
jgi:uncharacterized protein YjdB